MAEFEMSLVNTLTGQKLYSREVTGHHTSNESEPTKGFYGCLEDSVNQFISTEEFPQAIQVAISSITAQKARDGSDVK